MWGFSLKHQFLLWGLNLKMISANVMGGLGNQLFIICTALAFAERTGQTAWFKDAINYGNRPAYWNSSSKLNR